MPLYSRIRFVFSSVENHADSSQLFRWFGASRRLSSLAFARFAPINATPPTLAGQTMMEDPAGLNCYKKFGLFKRYYSNTRSTNNTKPPYLIPEEAATLVSWKFFLIPATVLAGFGGFVFFLHCNDEKRAVAKGKGEKFERSAIEGPIIGGPFTLIDTECGVVTEKNLLGNWVLLYFGYTSSPDVGPAEVRKMADTINILESKQKLKVLPIFVTIDPQRDTPSHLRTYIREFDSRIVGLTGPVGAVRQMAQEYRVFFRKVDEEGDDYLVESSHNMYLMNPNMEVERSFTVEYNAEELADAITKEMKKTKTIVPRS